jgi:serine/threonine-protein kinase PpkA
MLELPGYKIEKEIGKGGMARVYLALHEGLQRQVAIKVMSKHLDEDMGFSERFMREARIVANLNHQYIVTVYDVNVFDGYHYIAMEYLPGGITLDTRIKQGITPQEGLETIKHIAAALGYAHSKDIVHRDVKPENIMYREDGSAVLTDFGIARSTTATTKMTVTGTVIGTPHYMSPEQAQGKELGPCSDIYSLGVVFYQVLTGNVPYEADSTVSVLLKHISEPVPTLEAELAIYQPVLNCMMAKDKESRYQNCDEIIADIDSLLTGGDASNATTVINQALQETVVQQAGIPYAGTQGLKQKQKFLIAAITAGIFVAASAGGYIVYEQNQAAKQQQ